MDQLITPRRYTPWQLIKLFWQSEHKLYAYLFYIIMVIMTVCLVVFDVIFSYWSNYFYNALQEYDKRSVIYLVFVFIGLAAVYIIFAVYRYYISQLFGLRWRKWLTEQFIGRWLHNRDYYYLESFDEKTDNPDQRIQDDIGGLITYSINLSIGLVGAVTTFIGFIYVLWHLSGEIVIPLGSLGSLHVPGYLVWVAIFYSLIGTFFAFKIGFPLVSLNFEQQRREATFRFAAIDLRSHAEHIALYEGEEHQKGILNRLFGSVLQNWYAIILRQKKLLWFTAGYNQIAVLLPLLVALPNYFGKVFRLGGLMQSLRAFTQIQDALSFFVNSYSQIAEWRAITQRLITFLNHMQTVDEQAKQQNRLVFHSGLEKKIEVKHLDIATPDLKPLLQQINEALLHGHHYLIKGSSGIGKSTFLRTIAGIWPFAKGEVTLPGNQKIMYLPQKPYMPIGTLTEAILFPDEIKANVQEDLKKILQDCNLSHLIPRLAETATWREQLSPGEQQRIAFARVLLHQPDWVFLDESTSMVDLANEENLYRLLRTRLPACSIVSVGHRSSLETYHDHVINMAQYSAVGVS